MKPLLIVFFSLTLTACTTQLSDYPESQPAFDLATYFNGPVTAWGILEDYQSKVTRRFCVDIIGSWDGNTGTLDEAFYFDDGETDQRIWRLQKTAEGQYTGTAHDVVGTAKGSIRGSVFRWQYKLNVDVGDKTYQLFLDDWIYQIDEHRLFNRTKMKKFGIQVAELSIFFDKEAPVSRCRNTPLLPTAGLE
ncbi:DUF3833 domain-containing protein [Reinekea marinisedimentorum]|uniref:Uncharacterized protein DUF3833 n=1 Tax=Reinekea marinisedimentorum TaxID=230495 RepID=A0A4R3HV63_9GAMM|nr:DUF3833 domain-containing protein [Reinekea marinisedimentorum]TCS37126.1 uncharacterized protein DUF3833 [Reinekea marinisedimentorum]